MTRPDRQSLEYGAEIVNETVKALEAHITELGVNNAEALTITAILFARTVYWIGTQRGALATSVPVVAQETIAQALRWVEGQEHVGLVPLA